MDAGFDCHRIERLDHKIHGPHLESLGLGGIVLLGGDEDYRDMARLRVRLEPAVHLESIQARHDQIQQNQVGHDSPGIFQGLPVIAVTDGFTFIAFQDAHQQLDLQRVVVDDEYFRFAPLS